MSVLGTRKRRLAALVTAVGIVAAGTGLAYAYWTSTGHGTGSATTGTSTDFTVASTAATGADLTPGGGDQSVAFTVHNPGTGSENLASVVVTVANADGSAWTAQAGCSDLDYTVDAPVITYGEIAGGATVSGTVAIRMNDLASDQGGCKLATVPLYFAAS